MRLDPAVKFAYHIGSLYEVVDGYSLKECENLLEEWYKHQIRCDNINDIYGIVIGCPMPGDISTREMYEMFRAFLERHYDLRNPYHP